MPRDLRRALRPAVAVALVAAGLFAASALAQDEELSPTTRPTRTLSVTLPYSLLEDMSDEQRAKIVAIRTEIMEEIRALKAEEERQILEVLTPEQRERLPDLESEYRRERNAERRAQRDVAEAAEQAQEAAEAMAE